MQHPWQWSFVRPKVCAVEDDRHSATVQLDFTIACDKTGEAGTVHTLSVSWEVGKQIGAPPQKDGQLFVRSTIIVSRATVGAHSGKLHICKSALRLENIPCVH